MSGTKKQDEAPRQGSRASSAVSNVSSRRYGSVAPSAFGSYSDCNHIGCQRVGRCVINERVAFIDAARQDTLLTSGYLRENVVHGDRRERYEIATQPSRADSLAPPAAPMVPLPKKLTTDIYKPVDPSKPLIQPTERFRRVSEARSLDSSFPANLDFLPDFRMPPKPNDRRLSTGIPPGGSAASPGFDMDSEFGIPAEQPTAAQQPTAALLAKARVQRSSYFGPGHPSIQHNIRGMDDLIRLWGLTEKERHKTYNPRLSQMLAQNVIHVLDGAAKNRYVLWKFAPGFLEAAGIEQKYKLMASSPPPEGFVLRPVFVEMVDGGPTGNTIVLASTDHRRAVAFLIQRMGNPNRVPCKCCENLLHQSETNGSSGMRPFFGCRSLPAVKKGACGNCVFRIEAEQCSFHESSKDPGASLFRASKETRDLAEDITIENSPIFTTKIKEKENVQLVFSSGTTKQIFNNRFIAEQKGGLEIGSKQKLESVRLPGLFPSSTSGKGSEKKT